MIRIIILLCCIASSALAAGWGPGLNVRFEVTGFKESAFMDLPQSDAAAILRHWIIVDRPASPAGLESLALWCSPTDYAVCVFIDDTGYIAGLQIALDQSEISEDIYDWTVQGFTPWTVDENGVSKTFWTTQQYYVSADFLSLPAVIRIATRDPTTILQDRGIWVSGFHGELYNISKTVSDIENSIYTPQACIPLMGDHFYYNTTTESLCQADTLFPWFPLVKSNELIGLGFVIVGKYNIAPGKTDWFELPSRLAVQAIVPRGPECLYNLAEDPGLLTLHTYFINNALLLTC